MYMKRIQGFVGTYTGTGSEGLYPMSFDPETGTLDLGVPEYTASPSFLTSHPDEPIVYTVNETSAGGLTAFEVDSDSDALEMIDAVDTGRAGPCHVSLLHEGDWLVAAHYWGAAITVHPLHAPDDIGDPTHIIDRTGSGPNPDRQEQAHPHSAVSGPDGQYVYVPDLGTDDVVIYRFDSKAGRFSEQSTVSVTPGAGPRHFTLHPNHELALLINELDSTVWTFRIDEDGAGLTHLDSTSTLPDGSSGENTTAEIAVHPNGRWVYGSNRGHDSIARLELDPDSGEIHWHETTATRGTKPRHFTIAPDGAHLLVANQDSDTVELFTIDEETGSLSYTGTSVGVPTPSCIHFPTWG